MSKIVDILREFGVFVVIGLVGSGVLIYGLWGVVVPEKAVVEIVKSQSANSQILESDEQVIIDVAGAVEAPGVYKLPSGSRIGDALVEAGGLAAEADREWVSKNINLAKEIKDQEKIYIPTKQEIKSLNQSTITPLTSQWKVNINSASLSELDALAGIGEARAQAIIDNRPYGSTEELVSKARIPESVYEKIKDQVSIY